MSHWDPVAPAPPRTAAATVKRMFERRTRGPGRKRKAPAPPRPRRSSMREILAKLPPAEPQHVVDPATMTLANVCAAAKKAGIVITVRKVRGMWHIWRLE